MPPPGHDIAMIDDDKPKASGDRAADRRQREAAALRANLMRRKAQARGRRDDAGKPGGAGRGDGPPDDGAARPVRGDTGNGDDA